MCLMVNLGTVHSNFVKSMKLNVDVVRKERKDWQDSRTCIWPDIEVLDSSPTIRRFTLDYPIPIVCVHPIYLHQLREVLRLPTHPLLLNLFRFVLRKSDASIPVPSVARLICTTVSLPYPVFIDHVGIIFADILGKDPFDKPFVAAVLLREVGTIVCCHRHQ